MRQENILHIYCDKTDKALEALDTYRIFEDFDHNYKILWKDFYKKVQNIKKVKQMTLDSIYLRYDCTEEEINSVNLSYVQKYDVQMALEYKEHLEHLCEVFKEIYNEHFSNNIDSIVFKEEI